MWFWEIILHNFGNLLFIYLFIYHNGKLLGVKLLKVWDYGFFLNPQRLFNKKNPQLFAHTLHRFPTSENYDPLDYSFSFASTTFMKVGWKLDHKPSQSWRKERERDRSSVATQCMMPYQCLFFNDFFLDFNKEKGVVKGPLLLLLLLCSCLKTPLTLLYMVAKSSP
jgi:hypothetical protein